MVFVFFMFLRISANILGSLDCSHKRKTARNPIKIRRGQIGWLKITPVKIVSFMTNNKKRITQCIDRSPTWFDFQNYFKILKECSYTIINKIFPIHTKGFLLYLKEDFMIPTLYYSKFQGWLRLILEQSIFLRSTQKNTC